MHIDSVILQHIFNAISPDIQIHYRRIFQCTCLYAGRTPFGFISSARLYLYAPTDNRDYFVERGLTPLRPPITQNVSPSYFAIPNADLRDPTKLREWLLLALGNRALRNLSSFPYGDLQPHNTNVLTQHA